MTTQSYLKGPTIEKQTVEEQKKLIAEHQKNLKLPAVLIAQPFKLRRPPVKRKLNYDGEE